MNNPRVYTTLTFNRVEKSLADWGITNDHWEENNQSSDSWGCDVDALFDSVDVFPFGSEIMIQIQRVFDADHGTYSGGMVDFIGYRVDSVRTCTDEFEQLDYKFAGTFEFFFESLPFQQITKSWDNVAHANVDVYHSQITLGQTAIGVKQTFSAQFYEIVNFVIAQMVVEYGVAKIQFSDALSNTYMPFDTIGNVMAGEALRRMARWIGYGAVSIWVDYNTKLDGNPCPTLHCAPRQSLAAVTLTSTGNKGTKIARRQDLTPTAVEFKYRQLVRDGANTYENLLYDIACPLGYVNPDGSVHATVAGTDLAALKLAARKFRSVTQTFDFMGPSFSREKAVISTATFDATDLSWWASKCPELESVSSLALAPDKYGVSVTLESQDGRGIMGFANELKDGNFAAWMSAAGDCQEVVVTGQFSGQIKTDDGRLIENWQAKKFHTKIKLTNLAGGTYYSPVQMVAGEDIPFGLAKVFWDAVSIDQYQGTYVFDEEEISGVIGVGNVLNLTGGLDEWITMDAQVQQTSGSYTQAQTTVTVGVAQHLGESDMIARMRCNRGPRFYYLFSSNRSNDPTAGSNIELGKTQPKENSTPGRAISGTHMLYDAPDASVSGSGQAKAGFSADTREVVIYAPQPPSGQPQVNYGSFNPKLTQLDPAGGAGATDPMMTLNSTEEAKKRDIKLREISIYDISGARSYVAIPASSPYHKTSNDGTIAGVGVVRKLQIVKYDGTTIGSGTTTGDDVVYCVDPAAPTVLIQVAKPYALRKTPFASGTFVLPDGNHTYVYSDGATRTDTTALSVWTDQIWPPYQAGQPLYVAACTTGITVGGVDVGLLDINDDARQWGWTDTYCLAGTSKSIRQFGSKPY